MLPPTPVDTTNTPKPECSCLEIKQILETTNLALADLTESSYTTETSTALPLVRAARAGALALRGCDGAPARLNSHAAVNVAASLTPPHLPPRSQEVCVACLELLNTAGTLSVPNTGSPTGRRLLETAVTATTPDDTVCPNSSVVDPTFPATVESTPVAVPPTAADDLVRS